MRRSPSRRAVVTARRVWAQIHALAKQLPPGWRIALAAAGAAVLLPLALAVSRSGLESPDPTLLLRDRGGRFLGEVRVAADGEVGYWTTGALPERVVAATLALEDRRFELHPGVDPLAVLRAVRQNLRSGQRISGASTIAMQVARMQAPGRRSYLRKGVEALTAVLMTLRHGRSAVLAHYLRIVPYGNRIHGIAYAARRYFDKPVDDLSWAETAFLTAIPQSPARMNPFTGEGHVRAARRGRAILDRLFATGQLTPNEYALAVDQLETLRIPPAWERPTNALHAILRLDAQLRAHPAEAAAAPMVRTTLDLDLQERASSIVLGAVRRLEGEGARNAALVVVERQTNEVRAWVGSSDYFDAKRAGAIDYTAVPRSPGSVLKPFIYGLALDRGLLTPATILDDLDRGPGGIANADDAFLGPVLPRAALANSRNVPAAELLQRLGLEETYGFFRDLGLHGGAQPARTYGLGLAIGGLPVTLETLVRAYGVLATEGLRRDLLWYEGQAPTAPRRLLAEDSVRQIALFLSDPMARLPTFDRLGPLEYPFPVAVKTGTSSRFRDAWAAAFSSRYLVAAWVGDPDFHPMNRLTGSRAAARLVQEVLLSLHTGESDGQRDVPFPPPRGARSIRLCALTGRLATEACDRVTAEWLRPGEEPVDDCRAHVRLAVDKRTGALATARTPRRLIEVRSFVDLAPRYAAWAASAGLRHPPDLLGSPEAPSHPFGAASTTSYRLSVTAPEDGTRLLRDPETPPDQSTLALRTTVQPPVPQVVWYVDGRPYRVVDYPYATRWRLEVGEHLFQARLVGANAASSVVRVLVQ